MQYKALQSKYGKYLYQTAASMFTLFVYTP